MTRGVMTETETSALVTAAASFAPGSPLLGGRYRVERFLGRGAMGTVLLATHAALGHPVAVKVLSAAGESARRRFRQEALVAVSADHPHLVRLLDFGTEAGDDFLVMEFIDGSPLDRLVAEAGRLPETAALRVARDVLDGLAALHERGLVHRDVKPANVLVRRRDTRVKLADFGLAAPAEELARPGEPRAGTAAYMPPEVWRGGSAAPAGDVFAVGVLLFEALTGRRPWVGESADAVAWRIRDTDPPPLASILPDARGDVADFVAGLLAKDPAARPPAADARDDADALVRRSPGALPPRLVQNRLALVLADPGLAAVLAAALASESVLAPLLTTADPADGRLRALLPELDAVLIDPRCRPPAEVAAFVGGAREAYPWVVFFLLVDKADRPAALADYPPEWRTRLGHYFLFSPDRPVRDLPRAVRELSGKIMRDRTDGRSAPPPAGA